MTYNDERVTTYQRMVRERHRIWLKRQGGEPGPWTTDPVLSRRKFTNMFRVLDPGSQFVFSLASPDPVTTIARLVLYRITNKPETWYLMRNMLSGRFPTADDFRDAAIYHALETTLKAYHDAGNRVFSGAYIILPEPGTKNNKVEGVMRVTRRFVWRYADAFLQASSEDERYAVLRQVPGIGPFLAMQILTDWGYLQPEEPDLSFVVAGPGARRGAALLNPYITAEAVIYDTAMEWSRDSLVQLHGRTLTPMDVQNTMCEFGKYHREMEAPRKTTPYKPAHPGVQAKPVVPLWW